MGEYLTAAQTRAVLATRLASLCKASRASASSCSNRLVRLLEHDILPLIPAEGSVGASGDLTPLSYVAAVLCGEREVWPRRRHMPAPPKRSRRPASQPLRLRPKEGLAIMNGTAVMTALACLA